jgi:aspartyl-tRNA(Asn)/glutamyl-tRNA(Gln) amidotransferase subunit A
VVDRGATISPPTNSAAAIAAAVRRRELSVVEAVAEAFAKIDSIDGTLHAFCTLDRDGAFAQAAVLDARIAAGEPVGPLVGVPVAIKDLIATKGLRTTFGSPLYADFVAEEDDVAVERLKAAGAIVVGKTNASEFGYGPVGHNALFPTTRNPWNPTLAPGGSSAGSAAAVAAGLVPLALGSDGGGSIRIPASLCGVVGFKPSFGRIPLHPGCRDERFPGASGWESLEHLGPLARCVRDVAAALDVMAGPTPRDRHSIPREPGAFDLAAPETLSGWRIAYSPDLGFAAVDPAVAAIVASAARRFEHDLGCTVEIGHPMVGDVQDVFQTLVAADTDRQGLRHLAAMRGHRYAAPLAALLDRPWSADEFTAAIMARKRIANAMWRFMERYDLFLTPATAVAAYPLDRGEPAEIDGRPVGPGGWVAFSALANLTGQPTISVPAGFTTHGMPVGLQIAGRHLADAAVLSAAAAFEVVQPWAARRP